MAHDFALEDLCIHMCGGGRYSNLRGARTQRAFARNHRRDEDDLLLLALSGLGGQSIQKTHKVIIEGHDMKQHLNEQAQMRHGAGGGREHDDGCDLRKKK